MGITELRAQRGESKIKLRGERAQTGRSFDKGLTAAKFATKSVAKSQTLFGATRIADSFGVPTFKAE